MLGNKRVPFIDGLSIDEAHKGGGNSMAIFAAQVRAVQMMQLAQQQAAEQDRIRAEQEALLRQQEKKIDQVQVREDQIAAERKERMQNKDLLTGTEVGLTGDKLMDRKTRKNELITDTERGTTSDNTRRFSQGARKAKKSLLGETPKEATTSGGLL